jgi:hypothetical protein
VRFALADAVHFRGTQGIDLRAALVAVLVVHPTSQAHGLVEDLLQDIVAFDPAADVPQLAQGLVGALELVGVG